MAEGTGWSAGKIVLVVFLSLVGLGIICCGGVFLATPDEVKSMFGAGVKFGQQMAAGGQAFETGFEAAISPDGVYEMRQQGQNAMTLVIGVKGGPDPDEVDGLQDAAWKLYAESYSAGGFPLTGVGVGRASKKFKGKGHQGKVADWEAHFVNTDELVRRTGIEAPPISEFFEALEGHMEDVDDEDADGSDDDGAVEVEESGE